MHIFTKHKTLCPKAIKIKRAGALMQDQVLVDFINIR